MRTLNDLTAGTGVYLQETRNGQIVNAPYIYLGLDASGHALLLRKYCDENQSGQLRTGTSTTGGDYAYADSPVDDYLTGNFYAMFDSATQAAMVDTDIICMNVGYAAGRHTLVTLQRKIFLPSCTEMGYEAQTTGAEGPSYIAALRTYYNTEGDNAARLASNGPWTGNQSWWTRSPYESTQTYQFGRYGIGTGVYGSRNTSGLQTSAGVRPVISFDKTTVVSDPGTENIFLLPEGRDTTFNLNVKFYYGAFANRPKMVKVIIGAALDRFASYTLKVCNNYSDAEPNWVTCDADGVASLGDVKTTSDWRVGVQFIGLGRNEEAYIEQPNLIVEFEEE